MSPATKMLSVTTPLMSKARQPASQATPQKPVARRAPSSHSVLRIDPSEATTTSTSSVVPSESCARRTWPAASPSSASTRDTCAQVDPRVALHLGSDLADDAAERPDQWRISVLCDSDVQA